MSNSSSTAIDLAYRPRSYFWAKDLHIGLSSTIKGAVRRSLHERSIAESGPSLGGISKPALTEDERRAWGRLHPRCMGGEYLPDQRGHEVEIARIVIASTTQDVTCVYARARKGRIDYRVVDEYGGDTLSGRTDMTSVQPLQLGKLVDFFLGAWDLLGVLDANFEDDEDREDNVWRFISSADSSFYAQFGQAIKKRVNAWMETGA